MIAFPHDIIPCIPREAYGANRDPAVRSMGAYAGPSVNYLVNDAPSYLVEVTLDIDHAQYWTFQSFMSAINHGADWFLMNVDVGMGIQQHQCHMRSMYQASLTPADHWKVSMPLEVRMINAAA